VISQGTKTAIMMMLDTCHTRVSLNPQMASVGASMANAVAISPSSTNNLVNRMCSFDSDLPVPCRRTTTIAVNPTNAIDNAANAKKYPELGNSIRRSDR